MNNTNNVRNKVNNPSVKATNNRANSNTADKSQHKRTAKRVVKPVQEPSVIRIKGSFDRPMLIIIILLLCFGSIMVFSSSFASALTLKDDSYYYIKRQLIFLIAGFAIMIAVSRIDYRIFRRITVVGFIILLFLLALVPIFGLSEGQAVRWIKLGPIRFQPSEPMKTFLILMLAHYCATYQNKIVDHRDFKTSSLYGNLYPYIIVGTVCFLVALEKHFSGVIIIFLIGTIVIFASGARKFWMIAAGGVGGTVVLIAILFTGYAKSRIDTWLHPEKFDQTGEIWQTLQGLNAVGSGGFLGVGLGNSYQKYNYVAAPQNDFIFSILCEELGFVGAMAVIALFVAFVWRGFIIAMKAPDTFSSLVVIGIIGKVGIQAILNICVVTALIPNTGITLPFFSYGGSAMLLLLVEMGIVLSVSRYSYQDK